MDIRIPSADLRRARAGMSRAKVFEASVRPSSLPDFGHLAGAAVSFCELPNGNRVLRLRTAARIPQSRKAQTWRALIGLNLRSRM